MPPTCFPASSRIKVTPGNAVERADGPTVERQETGLRRIAAASRLW